MNRFEHGGNIERLIRETGSPTLLDLSASINPLGMPETAVQAAHDTMDHVVHYPDPECSAFVDAVAGHYGLDPARVLAANGSTELIFLLPLVFKPKRVLVTAPAFSEYERAATRAGAEVVYHKLREKDGLQIIPDEFARAMREVDIAFLCNPNNPTGHMLARDEVIAVARAAKRERCVLVVDEAFADFAPECSVIREQNPYLVVLRSMTKFHAMAGLRLGYGVFAPSMADRLRKAKEPWTVNSLALAAGVAALGDGDFAVRTLDIMRRERARVEAGLWEANVKFYRPAANYFLLKVKGALDIAERLLKEDAIAVRRCDNFRGLGKNFMRVALRGREENLRFLEALKKHV